MTEMGRYLDVSVQPARKVSEESAVRSSCEIFIFSSPQSVVILAVDS